MVVGRLLGFCWFVFVVFVGWYSAVVLLCFAGLLPLAKFMICYILVSTSYYNLREASAQPLLVRSCYLIIEF